MDVSPVDKPMFFRVGRGSSTDCMETQSPDQTPEPLRAEAGFALFEVLVSALLSVILAIAALSVVDAATRASGEERNRAEADGLAEQDQARMRSMSIGDLANLFETRTVAVDNNDYTIESRAEFVSDNTGTATCTPGSASADYLRVTSTVTWPTMGGRPPVKAASIVTPPNGSIAADRGALAVQVDDAQNLGISGVGLSGTGAGSFTGSTGSAGCAIFGNLPAGNYTLTPSGSGLVDKDGNPPAHQTTSVIAGTTNTVALQYDQPGAIDVTFTTKVGGDLFESEADSVVVFNTGMTEAKEFGELGTSAAEISAEPVFPFASPVTAYAGTCEGNNPNPTGETDPPGAAAMANVTVPAGGRIDATIQLPALHLTVWSGTSQSAPGTPVPGAQVLVADRNCSTDDVPDTRAFATDANGGLANPGLPWSSYDVCAQDRTRHVVAEDVRVKDLDQGTDLDLYMGGTGAAAGPCP